MSSLSTLNNQDPIGETEDNAIMRQSVEIKSSVASSEERGQCEPGKSSTCDLSPDRKNTC